MGKKRRRRRRRASAASTGTEKPVAPTAVGEPTVAAPEPRRGRARRTRARRGSNQRWVGIGVALLVVGATLFFTMRPAPAPLVPVERLAEHPVRGAERPLVTIVEYGDFGCPSCRAWHRAGIADRILAEFGEVVRFEWRDFPVITPLSPRAAEAAQCAQDQGRFWDYHDLLYATGAIDPASLKRAAATLGLDGTSFDACLDSGQHRATVQHDLDEGRELRLRGTPSFTINGELLTGPPSYETLRTLIERAVASGG